MELEGTEENRWAEGYVGDLTNTGIVIHSQMDSLPFLHVDTPFTWPLLKPWVSQILVCFALCRGGHTVPQNSLSQGCCARALGRVENPESRITPTWV